MKTIYARYTKKRTNSVSWEFIAGVAFAIVLAVVIAYNVLQFGVVN